MLKNRDLWIWKAKQDPQRISKSGRRSAEDQQKSRENVKKKHAFILHIANYCFFVQIADMKRGERIRKTEPEKARQTMTTGHRLGVAECRSPKLQLAIQLPTKEKRVYI